MGRHWTGSKGVAEIGSEQGSKSGKILILEAGQEFGKVRIWLCTLLEHGSRLGEGEEPDGMTWRAPF